MSEFSKGFKSRRPNKSFYDPAFASGWWVYGTLILSWSLDLLPLSHLPYFPSFLVLTLVFYSLPCMRTEISRYRMLVHYKP